MGSAGPELEAMEWKEGARQINECEYLFLRSIRESEELTLELTVMEAKPQAQILVPRDGSPLEEVRVGGRPIESDMTCRIFRLIFDGNHMVSYTVLNECYGIYPEAPEAFTGKLFRVFSWSLYCANNPSGRSLNGLRRSRLVRT